MTNMKVLQKEVNDMRNIGLVLILIACSLFLCGSVYAEGYETTGIMKGLFDYGRTIFKYFDFFAFKDVAVNTYEYASGYKDTSEYIRDTVKTSAGYGPTVYLTYKGVMSFTGKVVGSAVGGTIGGLIAGPAGAAIGANVVSLTVEYFVAPTVVYYAGKVALSYTLGNSGN